MNIETYKTMKLEEEEQKQKELKQTMIKMLVSQWV